MNPFEEAKSWISATLQRKVFRQLGFTYSSRMITAFLRLLASVIVVRVLGAERLGVLTIAAVIMGLTSKFLEMGLTTTMVRKLSHFIAQDDEEDATALVRRIFLFQVQISGLAVIAGYFLAPVIALRIYSNPELITPLRLAFFGAFVFNIWNLSDGILRAHERFKQMAIIAIVSHLLRTGFIALFAYVILFLDVNSTMMLNIAQILIAFAITSLVIPRRYITARVDRKYPLREVFSYSGWMYLFSLIFILFDRLDVLMLGYFRTTAEIGIYAVAFRLIIPFEMIPETFNTVFLPKVSKFTKKLEITRYFKETLKVTSLVGVLGIIMLFVARPLIIAVYGPEYEDSVRLFQILVGAFIALALLNPLILAGHSINKPQVFVFIGGVNLVLNFTGNLIFIPRYGALGAAVVTLISRVIGGMIGLVILKWYINRWSKAGEKTEETGQDME